MNIKACCIKSKKFNNLADIFFTTMTKYNINRPTSSKDMFSRYSVNLFWPYMRIISCTDKIKFQKCLPTTVHKKVSLYISICVCKHNSTMILIPAERKFLILCGGFSVHMHISLRNLKAIRISINGLALKN